MPEPNEAYDAAPTVEEVRVQQLKRKLQALHYTDPFDTTSLALVDKAAKLRFGQDIPLSSNLT
eukprot:8214701-Pyramimonas_sp.AAC.3